MRPFEKREMQRLYRFTKGVLVACGATLVVYGTWYFSQLFLANSPDGKFWFGIFPIYVGAMMVLIALAMREDWFTNARKYW